MIGRRGCRAMSRDGEKEEERGKERKRETWRYHVHRQLNDDDGTLMH